MKFIRGVFLILIAACNPASVTGFPIPDSKPTSVPASPTPKSQSNTFTPESVFLVSTPEVTEVLDSGTVLPTAIVTTISSMTVNIGNTFQVVVEGNPTTGFLWEIEQIDEEYLQLSGEPVYEPTGNLTGSGGEYTYQIKALKSGETVLKMVYHRPWVKGAAFAKIYELHIQIR